MPFRQPSLHTLAALTLVSGCTVHADEIHIYPEDSFESAVESLAPGDTLIVHEGAYTDSGRVSIGVNGTAANPVVVRAAAGEQRPLITQSPGAPTQNTINIEGAEHLTITGLEITSNGGDGINMSGNPSHIVLEDLVIHDISVGINFRSDMHHITVRRNHIYATNDTGEGMYVGCNNAACAVSDSIIENNWIHDTFAASQGDGIEIKKGSHSNIIRNNVIHDTNYPCILLYGTEGNPPNLVEGNVMWNCGDSGIQAAADALIRNNIILGSPNNGFNSQSHQGVTPANLEFVHNTVLGGSPCLRINAWDNRPGLVFANNAVYCDSANFSVAGLGGVTVAGNVFEPAAGAFPSSGYVVGRSESQDFVDAVGRQVYPTSDSALLGAGDPGHATAADFNGTQRLAGADAGAYAWTGMQNPGWPIAPGFKDAPTPGPTLTFTASPATVDYQGQSTLTWSTTHADSCTASGSWTGSKPTTGNETTRSLSNDATFTLACVGSGGSLRRSVTVEVRTENEVDTTSQSGAGSLAWCDLILFAAAGALTLRRRRLAEPFAIYDKS